MLSEDIKVGVKYQFRKPDGTVMESICTFKENCETYVVADFGRFSYDSRKVYKYEYRFEIADNWTEWKNV